MLAVHSSTGEDAEEESEPETEPETEELPPIDEEPVDPCLTNPSAPECQDPCVLNPDLPECPLPPPPCDPAKQECPAPPNKAPIPGTLFLPDAPPPGDTTTPGPPEGTTTPPGPTPQDSIDSDNDGVVDSTNDCLLLNSFKIGKWELLPNGDGEGDVCQTEPGPDEQMDVDTDGDGLLGSADNCPSNSNPDQTDADSDKQGDACDSPVLKPLTLNPSISLDITVENLDNCPSEPNPDQKDSEGDGIGDACDPDAPPIVAAEQPGACSAVATSGPTYIGEDGCPQPCPTEGQDIPTGCPQPVPLDPEAGEEPPVLFKPKRIIIPDDIASGPLIAPSEEAPEPQECGQGEAFNELTGQCEPEPEPEIEDPEEAEEEQQPAEESGSEDNSNN